MRTGSLSPSWTWQIGDEPGSTEAHRACGEAHAPPLRHHPRLAAAAAGHGVPGAVHALAGARDLHRQLLLDAAPAPRLGLHRARELSPDRRRSRVLEGALQQPVVRGRNDPGLDRPRDADGAVGQRPHRRPRAGAHGLFHADRAADDRGGQHLAVLLHAAIRTAGAGAGGVRRSLAQLAGLQGHGAGLRDDRRRLEGGRLLHDLLSRGAAADPAEPRPRRRRWRARRASISSGACSFRC